MTRTEVPPKTACDEDALFVMKGRDAQTKQLPVTEQGEEARCGAGTLLRVDTIPSWAYQ